MSIEMIDISKLAIEDKKEIPPNGGNENLTSPITLIPPKATIPSEVTTVPETSTTDTTIPPEGTIIMEITNIPETSTTNTTIPPETTVSIEITTVPETSTTDTIPPETTIPMEKTTVPETSTTDKFIASERPTPNKVMTESDSYTGTMVIPDKEKFAPLVNDTIDDNCDCLNLSCCGCFFPCESCGSRKCGYHCRVGREWKYTKIIDQGYGFAEGDDEETTDDEIEEFWFEIKE